MDQIEKEVLETIESGKYPIASAKIIKSIIGVNISNKTNNEINYTKELYLEYINELNKLDEEKLNQFLLLLKSSDVVENQKIGKEDSFLMSLYSRIQKTHAIDELLNTPILNMDNLKKIHEVLMVGTSSQFLDNYSFRTNDRKFVGSVENGKRIISYFPILSNEIENAVLEFLDYYNSKDANEDVFLKPILIHGILAALQVFEDGNTRLSRLLQHVKILENTNRIYKTNYKWPIIYVSRMYYQYICNYRNAIKDLVVDSSSDNVNEWLIFNYRRIQEQILKNNCNISKILKR